MRDTLVHRGPDGAGRWISDDGRIGLGHRRLAIIDLAPASAQPMTNETGTVQLVFNGEIYNYLELREQLSAEFGARFATDGDTEAIVAAYKGMQAGGGPKGVGDAVNESVVITFILLFVVNFVMSAIYFQLVPPKTG